MRIVIDGGSWTNRRGFGRFTRELVRALADHGRHEYVLVVDRAAVELPSGGRIRIVSAGLDVSPSRAAAADGWRSPADLLRMSRTLSSQRGDVVFFPCVYTYVPVWSWRPVVTGVHDTIAERFPELIFPGARARWFWNAKMAAALWQSTRIVTVSGHARTQVSARLRVPAARLRVVNEAAADAFHPIADRVAVRQAFAEAGLDADAPTLFYVGGLAPHKNLDRVIRAFAAVTDSPPHTRARLVLIGNHTQDVFHSSEQSLRALVASLCPGRVLFVGGVDDRRLALLLNGAQALVLASLDEGFGLPGIEAAACGTAVIATTESAMPEILGDAAVYLDPNSERSIAAALTTVLAEATPRERWGRVASERAGMLTWRRSAEALDAIFDELAPNGARR